MYKIIVFLSVACLACNQHDELTQRIETLAEYFIRYSYNNKEHKDVVNVGNGLKWVLVQNLHTSKEIEITVFQGDKIENDEEVTHTLQMKSPENTLRIRLNYDEEIDKFHIVGYIGRL